MTVRLLTNSDAAAMQTLYNTAANAGGGNGLKSWYPTTVVDFTPEFAEQIIANNTVRGSFSGSTLRGFVATRTRPLEEMPITETAEEIWLWVCNPSLSAANLKTVTKELFLAWWNDLAARNITWGWGKNAPVYPQRTENMFNTLIQRGMLVDTRLFEGRTWRIVKMHPVDALAVLVGW